MSRNRTVLLGKILAGVVICLGLLLAVGTTPVWAQSAATGNIFGLVTDPSGAVVVDATVTITDSTTGEARTTQTNESGRYIITNLAPGKYDIAITKKGFAAARLSGQTVEVGKAGSLNFTLPVGATTEVVEVQANNVQLQTTNATVGNTITGISLEALPSLGRDVSSFVTLQPGVAPDGSVAGAVYDQNAFALDGGQNTNDMDGSMNIYTNSFAGDSTGGLVAYEVTGGAAGSGGPTGVIPTPADSIEEFKVGTNNQTADFNSSAGAQVSMVTKRGTNSWHGTAYEYYLDNNFNANTWDNNNTGTPIPSYHYNRFGGAIGGPILPKMLGGKTYFFANYQGFRWPNSQTVEVLDPSASMRLGLLTYGTSTYNLNPTPVTFNGVTYAPTPCPGPCDPRGLGINPLVQQMWSTMPLPNDPSCPLSRCDANIQGFKGNLGVPQTDNFGVARLDHDFGDKWHLMSSYRYYKLIRTTPSQFDISSGTPVSLSSRPQVPWFLVAGLTTNITPNVTNDIHYSYLRNFWQWGSAGDPPQIPGLGGALEPLGEVSFANGRSLSPYNVNTQDTRTRFWDGQDNMISDNVNVLKGNHLFQFGGTYQRNFNYHQRTDNGGGINYQSVYQLGTNSRGAGIGGLTPFVPTDAPSATVFGREYAAVLGIVSIAQIAYTREGSNLALNPPLTPAFDQSTIPYYNVYFSDTWHLKPSLSLTYGMGWTLEMPPTEKNGKQVLLVDQSNQPIDTESYLHQRQTAALQGQVFNPTVGFALVGNVGNGRKYPYDPFYGGFSPRIALAWNPHFESNSMFGKVFSHDGTVIRGGYSRIYGRLNGVDLVLVPLLGTGLIQPVQCVQPTISGSCGGAGSNPSTAFRVGPTSAGFDGLTAPIPQPSATLPQPDFPGINAVGAGAGEVLDPKFRPNHSDTFDFTIQRQLSSKTMLEVGYIGRRVRDEYQPININAVPYMMTLGGQSFASAYAGLETSLGCAGPTSGCAPGGVAPANIKPQPFFEAAMNPAYCAGFSSCTAAVASNEIGNLSSQSVWSLYSDLDNGGFNFPRSMMNTPLPGAFGAAGQLSSGIGVNASVGYGNYNALFATIRMSEWHGLTMQSNFTWGKALGTGATVQATSEYTPANAFDLSRTYGVQSRDRKFVYNMFFVYQPPFFKGQKGLVGHVLGGWTFAPIFSAGSGVPDQVNTTTQGQSFGEGDASNFFNGTGFGPGENAVALGAYTQGSSRHNNVFGSGGIGTNGFGANMFSDPAAAYNLFRDPILGLDTGRVGGAGSLRGLPYWNVDFSLSKAVNITERVSAEFSTVFTNVFNHVQLGDPFLQVNDPADWGVLPGQANNPRQMEFGFRVRF